jgi:hypothetical protein
MPTKLHPPAAANHNPVDDDLVNDHLVHDPAESLTVAQKEALQSAVAKIVTFGAQVGLSADQMIQLLRSGLTVRELLEYLATRAGDIA